MPNGGITGWCKREAFRPAGGMPLLVYGEALRLGHKPGVLGRIFAGSEGLHGAFDQLADRLAQKGLRGAAG